MSLMNQAVRLKKPSKFFRPAHQPKKLFNKRINKIKQKIEKYRS